MRTDDRYIIHKCLNGDSAAFGILVDKYKASIYALAYSKLRSFHDAEDITQEAFIKAYRNLRTLRYWDDFPAWLYSITSNLCKNWIRSQSTRPDRDFVADQSPDLLTRLSMDSYREGMTRESVHEALNSLPEIYRQVLTLYYFSGMSIREIGGFLRIPPNTIAQRLKRARARMKQEMMAMMSETFEERKLQADFTFRIVEAVKRIKIQPAPRTAGLPWGLSLAAGVIIAVLSFNPRMSVLKPVTIPGGSPLSAQVKVLKAGEIPVDILEFSQVSVLASKQGDSEDGGQKIPEMRNTAPMASQGKGDTWRKRADMPTGRCMLSTSVVKERIYAIGGMVAISTGTSVVEEYDPATNTWTEKSNMPTARFALSTCTINGKIYAIGGSDGSGPEQLLGIVEEYDLEKNTWSRKADMPTRRYHLSASAVNGKLYAIGGWYKWVGDGFTPNTEEYDPERDTWTKKSDMPTKRAFLSTSVVNGKIYAIGGTDHDSDSFPIDGLPTVEEYDPVTDAWKKKADMPTARHSLSTSVVGGKIYAIGGAYGDIPIEMVEEYDPATDTWRRMADMPDARGYLSTSVVDGKIYVIGGARSVAETFTSTVEEYDIGFVPGESVRAKGKFWLPWGEIKAY